MRRLKRWRLKRWRLKRKVKSASLLMVKIQKAMIDLGVPRQTRKRVWGGFVKYPSDRKEILSILEGVIK